MREEKWIYHQQTHHRQKEEGGKTHQQDQTHTHTTNHTRTDRSSKKEKKVPSPEGKTLAFPLYFFGSDFFFDAASRRSADVQPVSQSDDSAAFATHVEQDRELMEK